jgi:hypothetical protein
VGQEGRKEGRKEGGKEGKERGRKEKRKKVKGRKEGTVYIYNHWKILIAVYRVEIGITYSFAITLMYLSKCC